MANVLPWRAAAHAPEPGERAAASETSPNHWQEVSAETVRLTAIALLVELTRRECGHPLWAVSLAECDRA